MSEPTTDPQELIEKLTAVLQRKDENGELIYSDRDLALAYPLVLISSLDARGPDGKITEFEVEAVAAFREQIGVPEDASQEVLAKMVADFYVENPLNPRLVSDLCKFLGLEIPTLGAEAGEAFSRFSGNDLSIAEGQTSDDPAERNPEGEALKRLTIRI